MPIHRVVTSGGDGSGEPLVLVADDDEDIRELVAFRLGAAGYKVVTACDGEKPYSWRSINSLTWQCWT